MGREKVYSGNLGLEDIFLKYRRLEALISIMQMYVSEVLEIAGEPEDCLSNGLFEIELEMSRANDGLKCVVDAEARRRRGETALKREIHGLVDKIEDEAILRKVYTFALEWQEGGAE